MLTVYGASGGADDQVEKVPVAQLDSQFEENAAAYLSVLPAGTRTRILSAFEKIRSAKKPLVQIASSNENQATILFVQGFDFRPLPFEWVTVFDETFKSSSPFYFFKWSRRRPFQENVASLRSSIIELLNTPGISDLRVVAYSAGGVLAVVSISDIDDLSLLSRLSLITVASPFYGYGMPAITVLATPFVGGTTIQLGRGIQHLRRKVPTLSALKHCSNWITTSCDRDRNACRLGSDLYPQLGIANAQTELPCGAGNVVVASKSDTHYSVLVTIVLSVISQMRELRVVKR